MRWLHLTDLHIRSVELEHQRAALKELFRYLPAVLGGPVDFVFISGDIAYQGKADEYDSFRRDVLPALREAVGGGTTEIVVVPGNHDIDLDSALPVAWDRLNKNQRGAFWEASPAGKTIRLFRSQAMSAFETMCATERICTVPPSDNVACVLKRDVRGKAIDIVLLNTALLSERGDGRSRPDGLPAPTAALQRCLQDTREGATVLVVGHHAVSDFALREREPFHSAIQERRGLYLHGHLHEVSAEFGIYGLRSLGFGAVYQAAAFDHPDPFYKNCFSVCDHRDELHVAVHAWDSVNGRWRPCNELPSGFTLRSRLLTDGYVLPKTAPAVVVSSAAAPGSSIASPHLTSIQFLGGEESSPVLELLQTCGVLPPGHGMKGMNRSESGRFQGDYVNDSGRHRVICIASRGHLISKGEVVQLNTLLDTEALESLQVLAIGGIASEARALYSQLERKKNLRIHTVADIEERVLSAMPEPMRSHLESLDARSILVELLVHERHWFLLAKDCINDKWFYLLDAAGEYVDETEGAVVALRAERPAFADLAYGADAEVGAFSSSVQQDAFDEVQYRARCYDEHNSVRYAALAAFGLRLPSIPLDQLYVEGRADVAQDHRATEKLAQQLDAYFEEYDLPEGMRGQLEEVLKSRYGELAPAESGAARDLYQQNGCVLVVGDPGSGKTCFAKREILAYCRSDGEAGTWYARHVPVFIGLAEASRLLTEDSDLLCVASQLCARRGLSLPADHARRLFGEGRLALFCDGLDEVPSLSLRARIVEAIELLMREGRSTGNRFVITSRPAAIDGLELRHSLRTLHLRGLTEDERRILARRVLAVRSTEDGASDTLDIDVLAPADEALVEKLLEDCRSQAGLGRLATNPLLLTLLVMTYSNSAQALAKRHRIYAEAARTLIAVRTRLPGGPVLPEGDVRRRLGKLALAMFRDPQLCVPTRKQVEEVLLSAMREERVGAVEADEAAAFLRAIAERTGLLVIHEMAGESGYQTVTFMHHSFLEYYAAVGLFQSKGLESLKEAVLDPRWREVCTLLAGILSDSEDASPLVRSILDQLKGADPSGISRMCFALECALEGDVPSEAIEAMLIEALRVALFTGALQIDSGARQEVGGLLAQWVRAARSEKLSELLRNGIAHASVRVRAATIDLIGWIGATAELPDELVLPTRGMALARETTVRCAVLSAASRAKSLRTDDIENWVRKGLGGDSSTKIEAARLATRIPLVAEAVYSELKALARKEGPAVASQCAAAWLSGRKVPLRGAARRDITDFTDVLGRMLEWPVGDGTSAVNIECSSASAAELLGSAKVEERLLAVLVSPWVRKDEALWRERLVSVLRSDKDPQFVKTALNALRVARGLRSALTDAELEQIGKLVDARDKSVRIASYRLIGEFVGNARAVSTLEGRLRRADMMQPEELGELLSAVAAAGGRTESVRRSLASGLRRVIGAKGRRTKRGERLLLAHLGSCATLDTELPEDLQRMLVKVSKNFHETPRVRQAAMWAYANVAAPDAGSVAQFTEWMKGGVVADDDVLPRCIAAFLRSARRRIEYLRVIQENRAMIGGGVASGLRRRLANPSTDPWDVGAEQLRWCANQLQDISAAFRELGGLLAP